ncbi:hypothetical protein DL93DRAFT_2065649 [Clavulina sp. PMI_390]|nr:hypothetical protein DL93DRAFT_2065649 [Clavulina sp. PMI_390]
MRLLVDAAQSRRPPAAGTPSTDGFATSVQNQVYGACRDRFLAANESNQKAEASVFADTGLMAMTCRHDKVIAMVNLTDPGERQFNALALVKHIFSQLPPTWRIGMLYDIGCQLDKSIQKHGFLPEYSGRLTIGVSVFHAFGHEFSCQCDYHPQKREGFGATDGEGCERCWNQLMKEIPMLRVSGVRH